MGQRGNVLLLFYLPSGERCPHFSLCPETGTLVRCIPVTYTLLRAAGCATVDIPVGELMAHHGLTPSPCCSTFPLGSLWGQ